MPRPRNPIPAYRHHKASGQAFARLSGKNYYFGRYGTPESKRRYAAWVQSLDLPPADPATGGVPEDFTVLELVDRYLVFASSYYVRDGKPTRHFDTVKLALRRVTAVFGLLPVREFGPRCLKQIREQMISEGLSRTYINSTADQIRRMFRWGVAEELVPPAVYQKLQALPGLRKGRTAAREPSPVPPVPDHVVDATLPHLPPVVADMVRFQRLTGCRPGEVCQLRPADVDRSGEVWVYRPGRHKTEHHGRSRLIFIGPKAQDVLLPYLLRPADAYCFSPADSEQKRLEARHARRKTPLSCGNRPGKRRKANRRRPPRDHYDKDAYARAIARAVDRANKALQEAAETGAADPAPLPRWKPNQLRHSAATEIRRRFGLEAAQVILGHAKADITEVYAERDARLAMEVAREIG